MNPTFIGSSYFKIPCKSHFIKSIFMLKGTLTLLVKDQAAISEKRPRKMGKHNFFKVMYTFIAIDRGL